MPTTRRQRRGTSEPAEVQDPEAPAIESSGTTSRSTGLFSHSAQIPARWPTDPEELKKYVDYAMFHEYSAPPPPPPKLPPRQKRWRHEGDEAITEMKDVPEGWNPNDLDIDEDDVDGQIERCLERIDDGIMPQIFEVKLEMYQKRKKAFKDMIKSEPSGLSWGVVQRLDTLKIIEAHVVEEGDPDDQLPNIRALMESYRSKKLTFKSGMVSYWSEGRQLNSPEKFDENVHKRMLKSHDTTRSWWVEGLSGVSPVNMGILWAFPPRNLQRGHEYLVDVSPDVRGANPPTFCLKVVHDTGADVMGMPRQYIDLISSGHKKLALQGYQVAQTAGGLVTCRMYEIDVTMATCLGAHPLAGGPWMRVQLMEIQNLSSGRPGAILSGPFLRFMCYTATCPDDQGNLHITWNKSDLGFLTDLAPGFMPAPLPFAQVIPASPGGGPPAVLGTAAALATQPAPSLKRAKTPTPTPPAPRKKQRPARP
ncbi:hypothetical protein N7457_003361 [Penicillium paradoxum]|uniref:uncharacterized protein n=1 Tax=Penicillium paradoxum TaxID=176176 RepID=UPI002548ACDF|nr:uncharacterized protein N7457_003361 [Penicillium paradoxum]KAJ5788371.1 hypothetical protein N7457_003361 [Penicillium paradoxum]